ncbi:MAG: Fic family protein [Actinomycetota bacterium]
MKLPETPPDGGEILAGLDREEPETVARLFGGTPTDTAGKYRHWDTMRRLAPPEGLTTREWWLQTKFVRLAMRKPLPLADKAGQPFWYAMVDPVLDYLHRVDQRAAGEVKVSAVVTNPATRDRYVVRSLIEEAITSSQLEGAVTTRAVAADMLRSGRRPRDRSERMIANNFQAVQFVRDHRDEPMTPELLCRLQAIVTEDTLDEAGTSGRFQAPGDVRVRVLDQDGQLLHSPPPAEELPERMDALCRFANGETGAGFMHPVVRAVVLHFWLAYDHPFADGNGRAARALFYWSMLHQGYWLAEFLSISRLLKQAPSRYARSFLYTETDDNDLTYFLLYQLGVLSRAIDEFFAYLARKAEEVRTVEALLRSSPAGSAAPAFNHRQLALLSHALRAPGHEYTFASHARSHNVARQSARTDLLGLESAGLLTRRKTGRAFSFHAAADLADQFRQLGQRAR